MATVMSQLKLSLCPSPFPTPTSTNPTLTVNNSEDLIIGTPPPNGPPSDRYHSVGAGGSVGVVQTLSTTTALSLRWAAAPVIAEELDVSCGGRGFLAPLDRVSIRSAAPLLEICYIPPIDIGPSSNVPYI